MGNIDIDSMKKNKNLFYTLNKEYLDFSNNIEEMYIGKSKVSKIEKMGKLYKIFLEIIWNDCYFTNEMYDFREKIFFIKVTKKMMKKIHKDIYFPLYIKCKLIKNKSYIQNIFLKKDNYNYSLYNNDIMLNTIYDILIFIKDEKYLEMIAYVLKKETNLSEKQRYYLKLLDNYINDNENVFYTMGIDFNGSGSFRSSYRTSGSYVVSTSNQDLFGYGLDLI